MKATVKAVLIKVAAEQNKPMTLDEYAVLVWETDKLRFGMHGFEMLYPNINKTASALMGYSGLIANGYIEIVENKPRTKYGITPLGQRFAEGAIKNEAKDVPKQTRIHHGHQSLIKWILRQPDSVWSLSAIYAPKIESKKENDTIILAHALHFIGLTDSLYQSINTTFAKIKKAIDKTETRLRDYSSLADWKIINPAGRVVTPKDLDNLGKVLCRIKQLYYVSITAKAAKHYDFIRS